MASCLSVADAERQLRALDRQLRRRRAWLAVGAWTAALGAAAVLHWFVL